MAGPELDFVESGHIAIKGNQIVELARGKEGRREYSDAKWFRFPGCIAVPAFVNAHVHLRDAVAAEAAVGQNLEKSVMGPGSTRARRVAASSQVDRIKAIHCAAQEMAWLGTAAVGDFCDGGVQGVAEIRSATQGLPIDVVVLGRLREPQSRDAVRENAALSEAQRSELVQLLELADGFAAATVNDYSDKAWGEIRSRARVADKIVAVHLAEQADQCTLSLELCGRSDVDRVLAIEPDHVVHLTEVSPHGLDAVIGSGIPVVVCPRSSAMTGLGHPPLIELVGRRHPVGLGTDNVMLNSPNLWREMEYCAKSYRAARRNPSAIDARDLLRCATTNSATALRLGSVLGSIEPRKRADFSIIQNVISHAQNATEIFSTLAHRLEPRDIVGRFRKGEWFLNATDQRDATFA